MKMKIYAFIADKRTIDNKKLEYVVIDIDYINKS